MANAVDPLDAQGDETEELKKKLFSFDYKGKRFVDMIAKALVSEAKFRTNKVAHWVQAQKVTSSKPEISNIEKLDFFIGRDESGQLRGGDLPWQYMQGVCDGQVSSKEKRKQFGHTLAQLPSHVSYVFKADPNIRDQSIVRDAFARAGFINEKRTTLIYRAEPGTDPLDAMKSDARTKIRKGRRELEFTSMGIDAFFDHYRANLGEKPSHFFLNIDQALLRQAVNPEHAQAEIIAVRRKADGTDKPQPVEAAAIISNGADGYCKLLRLTFRRMAEADDAPPPHQQALKVLIVEAMQRATERGLPLDVDGFTPGGNTLYSRFGGFQPMVHDQFTRLTPGAAILRLKQRVNELAF